MVHDDDADADDHSFEGYCVHHGNGRGNGNGETRYPSSSSTSFRCVVVKADHPFLHHNGCLISSSRPEAFLPLTSIHPLLCVKTSIESVNYYYYQRQQVGGSMPKYIERFFTEAATNTTTNSLRQRRTAYDRAHAAPCIVKGYVITVRDSLLLGLNQGGT